MFVLTSQHLRLARLAAIAVWKRMPKGVGVNLCDLESAATFGLVRASMRYREEIGSFETFAQVRIRGAILDCVRSVDSMGSTARKAVKLWAEAVGREPVPDFMEAASLASDNLGPEQLAMQQEEVNRIRGVFPLLTNREQLILKMRHVDGLSLREIAGCLKITESRVSQIQQRSHERLRRLLAPAKGHLRARVK